ncbi:somatostatin receptor type 1 isoform X1 [Hydra vulgaris]|uniref:Somatostatin receptor type 1 isoform X1 n=1 Tax=Hydra vulgaris TaxID=6087 RepID=A0ABM4CPH4_HYDVU
MGFISNRTENVSLTLSTPCSLKPDVIIYCVVCSIIVTLILVCNSIILVKLRPFSKYHHSNIEVLIFYLSLFDLMASIMLVMDVYEHLTCFKRWPLFWLGCKIIYPLYHISLNMSVAILIIMSVDRCRSITTPMKAKFSKKCIHISVMISFICSVVLQWYQIYSQQINTSGSCSLNRRTKLYSFSRILMTIMRDFTLIVVFTVTSALVFLSFLKNELYIASNAYNKSKPRKVMLMLVIMEVVFTLLVIPYDTFDCIMLLKYLLGVKTSNHNAVSIMDQVLSILQMSNCFANYFIYSKMRQHLHNRSISAATFDIEFKQISNGSDISSPAHGAFESPVHISDTTIIKEYF